MTATALIVAAGRGLRAGGEVPKQYRLLHGRPVLSWTLEAFASHAGVADVLAVIHPDDRHLYDGAAEGLPKAVRGKLRAPVHGGETRQDSVRHGLEELGSAPPEIVLVHDGARPFASGRLIADAIAAAKRTGAAVPGCTLTDTVKVVDSNGRVVATPDRAALRSVQTPQAFHFDTLLSIHRQAVAAKQIAFTDDAAIAEWAGASVHVFEGDAGNMKLTHPEDFAAAERRFGAQLLTRVGTGFDVHAFAPGDHIWLGGVRIEHENGVSAHSDGDVILHALTDAVLGALAEGDIGVHFPPSDPQWRGASSDRFLGFAAQMVREAGGTIDHLDVTLLCEKPRLGPHREAMRERIAGIAGIERSQVSLKATTTERLGFTGRGEGLAAQALATIRMPERSR